MKNTKTNNSAFQANFYFLDNRLERPPAFPLIIFPGSFNPLHEGHVAIGNYIRDKYRISPYFEIALHNADKHGIQEYEAVRRSKAILKHGFPVLINASLLGGYFVLKSDIYGGECNFIVGTDTIKRIDDVRFYGNDEVSRDNTIKYLAQGRTKFMVIPRYNETLSDLTLSARLRSICVDEKDFTPINISSSELREKGSTSRKEIRC